MVAAKLKKKKVNPVRVLFIVSFTILPVIHFLVMYVYVNVNSFAMGFQQTIGGQTQWTFANFTRFFNDIAAVDSVFLESLKNTLITFTINLIMFPIGVFVSYFLYKKIWGYKIFRIIFFLPSIILPVIIINIFKEFLASETILIFMQKSLGLDYIPEPLAQIEFANIMVLVCMVWLSFPGNLVIWGGTFSRIPDSILESAKLDGVNWWQEAFKIIIPIVWPTFALMLMLQLSGIFGASGPVFLLTNGEWGTNTISSWMYLQVYNAGGPNNNALNYMSAVGLMITVIAIGIALGVRKFMSNFFQDVEY